MVCPEVFDVDESGYGVVLAPDVPAGLTSRVTQAEMNCPEGAIRITRSAADAENNLSGPNHSQQGARRED